MTVPKCNNGPSSSLENGDQEINIPPNAVVYPNIVALQSHPDYWGADCLDWNPQRWVQPSDSSVKAGDDSIDAPREELRNPVRGSYIPWGDGPRVCPGRKFSHVEFVAVLVTTLWNHSLEVVPESGETDVDARKRVKSVIDDSTVGFTLAMKSPETVRIRLV
jgi:cytochrome P450